MSCFMVEDSTIGRIAGTLANVCHCRQGPFMYIRNAGSAFGFHEGLDDVTRSQGEDALAQSLYALNCEAYGARYEGRHGEPIPKKHFEDQESGRDPWQVLKSLDCFLYQCSEGDIPEESTLYQKLAKVRDDLARVLASSTPQYESAKWE